MINFLHYFSTIKSSSMKNRNIIHAHEEVKIYGDYYKPSLNVLRFAKSILSVFINGSSVGSHNYVYSKKRWMR